MNNKSITYDPSARKWLYSPPGGVVLKFPPGPEGRQEARLTKIKAELPRIYNMLTSLQANLNDNQVQRRATDGAMYMAESLVLAPSSSDAKNVLARVGHSTKTVEYLIQAGPPHSLYRCSCPDWEHGLGKHTLPKHDPNRPQHGAPYIKGAGIMCKHAWGYHFTKTDGSLMSIQHPNSKELAEKLLKAIKTIVTHQPLSGILEASAPMMFSRGDFSIAVPDEQLTADHTTQLKQAVLELTAKSFNLIIY